MDQTYAEDYRDLYQRHWWWRSREQEILRQLEGELDHSSQNQILDVGCGDGLFFEQLQRFGQVTGIEGDPHTLTEDGPWREQIHCRLFDEGFAPDQRYDVILMLDILEHMPDPAAALTHARSLLKPDGRLIATVPAFMALWTSHDDLNHHVIRYDRRGFSKLISTSGFDTLRSKFLFHWTCPVKLLIRLKEKLLGATPAPPKVPSMIVNRICELLSRMEQATISKIGMPFGSSLMVIAKPLTTRATP